MDGWVSPGDLPFTWSTRCNSHTHVWGKQLGGYGFWAPGGLPPTICVARFCTILQILNSTCSRSGSKMEDGCIQETIAAIDKEAGMQHKCTNNPAIMYYCIIAPRLVCYSRFGLFSSLGLKKTHRRNGWEAPNKICSDRLFSILP